MAKKTDGVLKVTSLEDLKGYTQGEIVSLPGFSENQPFVVRMKKPDLMTMVAEGVIPNTLLKSSMEIFGEDSKPSDIFDHVDFLKDLLKVGTVLGKACFLEPTWEEFESSGMKLTFDQARELYTFAQQDVGKLTTFRKE